VSDNDSALTLFLIQKASVAMVTSTVMYSVPGENTHSD